MVKDDSNLIIRQRFDEHGQIVKKILSDETYMSNLCMISQAIVDSYRNGCKVLLCGNGGSAADAQHLAAELVSKFYKERKALSAEALNANTSIITAIGNDYEYSRIFARSVEAQGRKGDVLIGITTSGKSKNIIEAFKTAKSLNLVTVLFTGIVDECAEIFQYTDFILSVPSNDTPRIQEIHILSGHIMCELIENNI
jgi:D-sedoheptulose 7-phosphate isomerase